jgi:sec-independent protein translocase protein TatA
MGRIGVTELLLILAIALLIFGPSKLADMGKGLGEGLKSFKKGISSDDDEKPPAPPPAPPAPPAQKADPKAQAPAPEPEGKDGNPPPAG